jgi:hypothetical protein
MVSSRSPERVASRSASKPNDDAEHHLLKSDVVEREWEEIDGGKIARSIIIENKFTCSLPDGGINSNEDLDDGDDLVR